MTMNTSEKAMSEPVKCISTLSAPDSPSLNTRFSADIMRHAANIIPAAPRLRNLPTVPPFSGEVCPNAAATASRTNSEAVK